MIKLTKHILGGSTLKDKIRIFMMLTICVSFLFFSMATTHIYKELFHENTNQLMQKNFNLTYSSFEKIIDNAKNACSIIENDGKIYDIISKETDFINESGSAFYEGYGTYINMQNVLVFSADTYDIDGISIYTNSGCIYGEEGKTYFDMDKIRESRWFKYLDEQKNASMFCNHEYFSDLEQTTEGNLYYIKLVRSRTSGKYIGAIRVTISSQRIENLLYSNSPDLNNTTFLQNDLGETVTPSDETSIIDVEQTSNQTFIYDGESAIISQQLTGTNLYLLSITSYKEALKGFNKIKFLIYAITFIIILISYKLSKSFSIGITKRLSKMMDSMDNVKHGRFQPVPSGNHCDDIELCINNYNDMLLAFQKLLNQQKEHEIQKRNFQLKLLQEQIKPHFLYNTLELINHSAIVNNIPEISETVLELSSFYRLSLNQGGEIHTLKDELNHISLYFSLQNKRAQKPLTLTVNAPEELLNAEIPKLILQPIIENSYYHAFPSPTNKENAKIEVTVKKLEDDLIIELYDNGIGIPYDIQKNIFETESRNGFGLKNINERINLFFGNGYGLSISSVPDVETTVRIKLPYKLHN